MNHKIYTIDIEKSSSSSRIREEFRAAHFMKYGDLASRS